MTKTYTTRCSKCRKIMTWKDGECATGTCIACREPLRLKFWELFNRQAKV